MDNINIKNGFINLTLLKFLKSKIFNLFVCLGKIFKKVKNKENVENK
tara:strand:+ start:240 stop:380 length:141 start_codon:yes stop_codon:yes gene_type:complete